MASWRTQTFDRAIMEARKRGFDDPDFDGWEQLDGQTRIGVVNQILHHNGLGQVIFRKSFARALFGSKPAQVQYGSTITIDPMQPGWKAHLQNMVVADDWLIYLREFMNAEK